MTQLAPSQAILIDTGHAEVHFAIGGFWTCEKMEVFLKDLTKAAEPFLKAHKQFSVLGDLREFVPQNRRTADAIRDSIISGRQNGLTRFAVVTSAPLVKMQYRRVAEGIDMEFFDTPREAEMWLRSED